MPTIEREVKEFTGDIPAITSFVLSSGSITNERTIQVSLDGTNVTAWMITESEKIPAVDDPRWLKEAPGSYTLSAGDGEKKIYLFVKDADGYISKGGPLTVVLDTAAPEITQFAFTTITEDYTTDSTVDIDLAGSSDIELWAVTDISTPPAAGSPVWQTGVPTSYGEFSGEGDQWIYAWAMDGAGNVSNEVVSLTIYYYANLEISTFSTPQPFVADPTISITLVDTNVVSWLVLEEDNDPSDNSGDWVSTRPTEFTLSGAEGSRTLYAWGKNGGGAMTSPAKTLTVTYDVSAPEISDFSLTSADPTNDRNITFDLTGTDNIGISGWFISEVSTTPAAGDTGWIGTTPGTYRVSDGDEEKTVYMWAKDAAGNISPPMSLSVTLNRGIPVINTFTVPTNTNTATIDVIIDSTDLDLAGWMIKEDDDVKPAAGDAGWSGTALTTFDLTDSEGTYTLYAWIKDDADNVSAYKSQSVILDKTLPTVSIALDPGQDASTSSFTVAIEITESDNTGVVGWYLSEVSTTPDPDVGIWATSEPSTFNVADSQGEKTIYCWVKDAAKNVSTVSSVSLYYYKSQPTITFSNDTNIVGHETLVFTFSETMDTSSLSLSGTLAALPSDYSVNWTAGSNPDDTLTLSLETGYLWQEGARTLSISCTSDRGSAYGGVPLTGDPKLYNLNVFYGVYVSSGDLDADDAREGTLTEPKKTIQAGIDEAADKYTSSSSEVRVASGTYQNTVNGTPVASVVEGVSLYGGYSSDFSGKSGTSTIIDFSTTGGTSSVPNSAIFCDNLAPAITTATIIDGFTVKVGKGSYNAAIFCDTASPTIQNVTLIGRANTGGVSYGIRIITASPVITNNQIFTSWEDLRATESYGIYSSGTTSAPVISANTIHSGDGVAAYGIRDGGGAGATISDNSIYANDASACNQSYGIFVDGSGPVITNNSVIDCGGGLNLACCIRIQNATAGALTIDGNVLSNLSLAYDAAFGIYESTSLSEPASVQNNDFDGFFGDGSANTAFYNKWNNVLITDIDTTSFVLGGTDQTLADAGNQSTFDSNN